VKIKNQDQCQGPEEGQGAECKFEDETNDDLDFEIEINERIIDWTREAQILEARIIDSQRKHFHIVKKFQEK